ncbi:MAG: zinc-ribbon domain-containing protein [Ruminococcus sp.]|jgi:hypothetical protein
MYCENCGARNEDDARFCSECGAPLQQTRQQEARPPFNPQREQRYQPSAWQPPEEKRKKGNKKGIYPLTAVAVILGVLIVAMAAVLIKTSYDTNNREDKELEALLAEAEENGREDGESEEIKPTEAPTEAAPTPTVEATPQVTAAPTAEVTPVPTQEVTPQATEEYVAVKYGLQAPASDFMFPYSSERLLTQAELDSMVDASVEVMHSRSQLAINEILARYGYSFNPDGSDTAREIYNRVAGKDWYQQAQQQCGYTDPNSLIADMNSVEKENINMINEWQQAHGCYY